jgi:hypothetical protein
LNPNPVDFVLDTDRLLNFPARTHPNPVDFVLTPIGY